MQTVNNEMQQDNLHKRRKGKQLVLPRTEDHNSFKMVDKNYNIFAVKNNI